ncbi:hypothetical protein EG329_011156 [Mollisiaceae sp. DMI_Dod_QoI]|nr:hypothetical protein EG329_011156 [Helotiales sp. DMI_Dod_QoI]
MLGVLVQFFIIHSYAASINNPTNAEDLSRLSRGPEMCPGQIAWPQVPVPISCDDPACRGISWAVPPYRCRKHDGVMFGVEVFGCRCCPRLVDCNDPQCAGSPSDEICRSELLLDCVCVSSNRRAPPLLTSAPVDDAAAAAQVEDKLADLSIYESLNTDNDIEERRVGSSSRNCPRDPPARCLDPQCRGSDDWQAEMSMSTIPRCNQAEGKLVIDGTETALHGCPCCPEYIACSSTECNGSANQACTSVPLHGCFCDWPGRGPVLTTWDGPDVSIYDADAFLDDPDYQPASWMRDVPPVYINDFDELYFDPNYHPLSGQISSTTAVSFTASSSMYETRPLATQITAPAVLQNFTWMDFLPSRQEAFSLSQNGSVFVIPDYFKHT